MSLFCPPAGFPVHLAVFWPFIWAQILVMRAWVRAAYGKGTLYRWSVTPHGRVFVTQIVWVPCEGEAAPAPVLARLAARAQARIAALTGDMLTPPETRPGRLACPGRMAGEAVPAAVAPEDGLPLPDI